MSTKRTHKVGTLTLGITLVVSGIFFLLHLVFPTLTYFTILKAWPIIFIFLGIEILFQSIKLSNDEEDKLTYDKTAIFLTALVILFAMCIGSISTVMERSIHVSF